MATINPPDQVRFKQLHLFTDQADDAVIRHLNRRDSDLQVDELMNIAAQVIAQHPTRDANPLLDIEELPIPLRHLSREPRVRVDQAFSQRFRLNTSYPSLFHLISQPHLRPCFTTPIWVITSEEDSSAAFATIDEIDNFNRDRFNETYLYGTRAFEALSWNKLLLNPNEQAHSFVELYPIKISRDFDPTTLKYLGAHLNHLEKDELVDDDGFIQIRFLKRAAILGDPPKPDITREYVVVQEDASCEEDSINS